MYQSTINQSRALLQIMHAVISGECGHAMRNFFFFFTARDLAQNFIASQTVQVHIRQRSYSIRWAWLRYWHGYPLPLYRTDI